MSRSRRIDLNRRSRLRAYKSITKISRAVLIMMSLYFLRVQLKGHGAAHRPNQQYPQSIEKEKNSLTNTRTMANTPRVSNWLNLPGKSKSKSEMKHRERGCAVLPLPLVWILNNRLEPYGEQRR